MQRSFLKRFFEKFIEGLLMISGTVTSLTVVLIVIFLFREGADLLGSSPIEEGSNILISAKNPVKKLSALQVKQAFDQEVFTWKEFGGSNDSIVLFDINQLSKFFTDEQLGDSLQNIPHCIDQLLDSFPNVIAYVPDEYIYENKAKVLRQAADGGKIVLNRRNPVQKLSSAQIKMITEHKVTQWSQLREVSDSVGFNDSILFFSEKEILAKVKENGSGEIPVRIDHFLDSIHGSIAILSDNNILPPKFPRKDFKGRIVDMDKISAGSFLGGKLWFPSARPAAQIGALPLILGTLWVSLGAILLALPLGLAAAIYMAEIAKPRVRNILKPLIELLAGIPSVVYGFFGLVVIAPFIQNLFNLPVGETALAGSVVLAIMALPTIITISEDAMRTTPRSMKEASLALGATHWQTITRVIIPYSASGITAGAILGIGRAIGETMAVLMVTGNAAVIPHTILEPVRTIPATIAAELGEATQGGLHYKALFALGCILFVITFAINLLVSFISSRNKIKSRV